VSTVPPFSVDRPPQRILVVRLGAVGDLVRTLPAVRQMRRAWPEARIGWLVEAHLASFLAGHPDVDEWLTLDRRTFLARARRFDPRALGVVLNARRRMHEFGPELTLDFQGSLKSGLASWLSGARVRMSFERRHVREWSHLFATHRVPLDDAERHRVRRALALARAAGAGDGEPVVDLALTEIERARARERAAHWKDSAALVALAPFTSRLQAWKRYPLERWSEIARALASRGMAVLVIAGPGEEREAHALAAASGEGVSVCEGIGLRDLAALLEQCTLLIGGDTGPMHMAWALGTRVVALFGPTDPGLNSPVGNGHAWLAPEVRTRRDAPDKFPGITPELVVERALAVLQAGDRSRASAQALPREREPSEPS
jgi:lipopolysaccharide heptosyltransferase I